MEVITTAHLPVEAAKTFPDRTYHPYQHEDNQYEDNQYEDNQYKDNQHEDNQHEDNQYEWRSARVDQYEDIEYEDIEYEYENVEYEDTGYQKQEQDDNDITVVKKEEQRGLLNNSDNHNNSVHISNNYPDHYHSPGMYVNSSMINSTLPLYSACTNQNNIMTKTNRKQTNKLPMTSSLTVSQREVRELGKEESHQDVSEEEESSLLEHEDLSWEVARLVKCQAGISSNNGERQQLEKESEVAQVTNDGELMEDPKRGTGL